MSSLNTQLTINLSQLGSTNTVSVSYKPGEVQATAYSPTVKTLNSLLGMGTKTNPLHAELSKLNNLFTTQVNIQEHLVAQGVQSEDIKPELTTKKVSVIKLLSSMPSSKQYQLVSILTNTFIKEPEFYNFSIGLLDVVGEKIKSELAGDFTKINRRIDDSWKVQVSIESINTHSYHKTSSFSFKDNYEFLISDIGGTDSITKTISTMFGSSIKPYADIYMEKIVTEAFRVFGGTHESPYGIYNQIEKLAWNLFCEDGSKRHTEPTVYSQFDELVQTFEITFPDNIFYRPVPQRQVTAAISMTDDAHPRTGNLDYKNFGTYHNSYHYKHLELKKKDLPIPPFMTLDEIQESIHRTKRYFTVYKLGDETITKFLEQKDSLNDFPTVVSVLQTAIDELVSAVCMIYKEDSELTL